ncbi:hypothetical protein CQW23_12715 [Capsicum baccatum]|uniref:Factor of DNA methylation 1-5/IDN2 domain-containing protein n=1 Tax=Capsicum baccatum TaxID=33114 RepID=A0A2G2WTE1_CAPBA|nr:hypothetical protein CQW23_12715 [Capsicum baccatum]
MDDEDEKLKDFNKNYGEEVYKVATTTFIEFLCIISELWNYAVNKNDIQEEGGRSYCVTKPMGKDETAQQFPNGLLKIYDNLFDLSWFLQIYDRWGVDVSIC